MKKKVGELYGKPIIEGDKNLKTNNEVHISELTAGEENVGSVEKPAYIGFEIHQPDMLDEGNYYRYSKSTIGEGDTWEDFLKYDTYPAYGHFFSSDENNNVTYNGYRLYHDMTRDGWAAQFSNPVKTTDIVESKVYYLAGGSGGGE